MLSNSLQNGVTHVQPQQLGERQGPRCVRSLGEHFPSWIIPFWEFLHGIIINVRLKCILLSKSHYGICYIVAGGLFCMVWVCGCLCVCVMRKSWLCCLCTCPCSSLMGQKSQSWPITWPKWCLCGTRSDNRTEVSKQLSPAYKRWEADNWDRSYLLLSSSLLAQPARPLRYRGQHTHYIIC